MNYKLADWASVAEIVSGIAVVITLIFLIVGIQENTAVTRVSVYDNLMENVDQLQLLLIQDAEVSRIAGTLISGETEGLNASDRRRLTTFARALLTAYERAYFSREYDVIGNTEWARFESAICTISERAEAAGLAMDLRATLTEEFRSYVSASCAVDLD